MTAASLEELRGKLDHLRTQTQIELAQRLREARAFGAGSNNDDFHALGEEQMVLDAESPRWRTPSPARRSSTRVTSTRGWR